VVIFGSLTFIPRQKLDNSSVNKKGPESASISSEIFTCPGRSEEERY
jgi:hypothetical protein